MAYYADRPLYEGWDKVDRRKASMPSYCWPSIIILNYFSYSHVCQQHLQSMLVFFFFFFGILASWFSITSVIWWNWEKLYFYHFCCCCIDWLLFLFLGGGRNTISHFLHPRWKQKIHYIFFLKGYFTNALLKYLIV